MGQGFGVPLTCTPASSWGGAVKTQTSRNPCHWKSSSGHVRFGAGLIRLQWECGGCQASQAGGAGAMEQFRVSCTRVKVGAVPAKRRVSLLSSGEGQGIHFCVALHRECQGSLREGCTGTAELLVRDFGSEVTGAVLQMALGHLSGDQAQVTFQAGQTGCVPFASLGREFLRWE